MSSAVRRVMFIRGLGHVEVGAPKQRRARGWRSQRMADERDRFERETEAVRRVARSKVKGACTDGVRRARAKGRAEVAEAKKSREARNTRAKSRCETVRTGVARIEASELERIAKERGITMAALRAELYPKAKRSRAQEVADVERGRRMKAKRGKRVTERVELESADVPPEWRAAFMKDGARWVRAADASNRARGRGPKTTPAELFLEYVAENRAELVGEEVDRLERESEQAIRARRAADEIEQREIDEDVRREREAVGFERDAAEVDFP